MKTYHCIQELIYELADLNWDSAIFVNQSAWMDDPQRAEILILGGDDELEDVAPGTHLPKIARNNGMGSFSILKHSGMLSISRKKEIPSHRLRILSLPLTFITKKMISMLHGDNLSFDARMASAIDRCLIHISN